MPDYLDFIVDGTGIVPYRPMLNKITGSIIATLILQQMIYWFVKSGRKKFYKFRAPCNHEKYREGDSWCEELGLTGKEFDYALNRIAFKTGKNKNNIKKEDAFIVYYTDKGRITWYKIQENNLRKALFGNYIVIDKKGSTKKLTKGELPCNSQKGNYNPSEINTENNTETDKTFVLSKTRLSKKSDRGYKKTMIDPERLKEEARKKEREKINKKWLKHKTTTTLINHWRVLLSENGYGGLVQMSFTQKEFALMKTLIRILDHKAKEFLTYAIENWGMLKNKITWNDSGKTRLPKNPSFMSVYLAKEDILMLMGRETVKEFKNKIFVYKRVEDVPKHFSNYKNLVESVKKYGYVKILKED